MISWIQQTFQHHFRTVFFVLLAILIVSFVFVTGAAPGSGQGDRQLLGRPFFGLNLASPQDEARLVGDAQLSVQLQYGYQVLSSDQMQQYAFVRQASLHLADQLHVPNPGRAEMETSLKTMRLFAGENGQFDGKRYDDFRRTLTLTGRFTEADVARVVTDNLRIERIHKLISGPGYALPADIVQNLERVDTSWTLVTAKLDRASFQPTINPTEADLTTFFETNGFRYTIPQRILASYALFPTARYAAQVQPSEGDLRAFFDANPSRFAPADAKPAVGEAPAVDFLTVRAEVAKAYIGERAARLASEDANRLALELDSAKVAIDSAAFVTALQTFGVTAKELPAFTIDALPAELGQNPQVAEEAGRLAKDRTVSDAVNTELGSVVLFYKAEIPPTQPTLAEVRAKVLADYKEAERIKRFASAGAAIAAAAQSKVAAGQPFETAVTAAAAGQGIKAEVKKLSPFTFRQPPQDVEPVIYNTLLYLKKGQVSELASTADAGYLVYALDRQVPDLSEGNPNYAELRTRFVTAAANANAGEYLRDMITKELEKSEIR